MPRKPFSRKGKDGKPLAHILFAGAAFQSLKNIVRNYQSFHDSTTARLCSLSCNPEQRFQAVLKSVHAQEKDLLPRLNVIFEGKLVIQNGKLVPKEERVVTTREELETVSFFNRNMIFGSIDDLWEYCYFNDVLHDAEFETADYGGF
jgi:hypothetical protein